MKIDAKGITLQEAADRLGIDRSTAYRWAVRGKLKITFKIPRNTPRIWVSEESINKIINEQTEGSNG